MINIILFDDMLKIEFSLYRAALMTPNCSIDTIVEGRRRLAEVRIRRLDYINNALSGDAMRLLDQECLMTVKRLKTSILLTDAAIRAFIMKWPVEIAIKDLSSYRIAVAAFLDRMSAIMNWQSRITIDVVTPKNSEHSPQSKEERPPPLGEWCRCRSYAVWTHALD